MGLGLLVPGVTLGSLPLSLTDEKSAAVIGAADFDGNTKALVVAAERAIKEKIRRNIVMVVESCDAGIMNVWKAHLSSSKPWVFGVVDAAAGAAGQRYRRCFF